MLDVWRGFASDVPFDMDYCERQCMDHKQTDAYLGRSLVYNTYPRAEASVVFPSQE